MKSKAKFLQDDCTTGHFMDQNVGKLRETCPRIMRVTDIRMSRWVSGNIKKYKKWVHF